MHQVIYPFHFFTAFRQVMLRAGWMIYILVVAETWIDQWTTTEMQNLIANPEGTSPILYLYGLFSIVNSIFFPSLLLVVVVSALSRNWDTLIDNLNQVLIEILRAWGRALKWGFLLILPGVVKWLRLSFVPFIVMTSPAYQRGEVDALDESERLADGELLTLLIPFFLMAGVFPMLLTSFDEFKNFLKTPGPSLFYYLAETLIAVIFCLWLLKIYAGKVDLSEPLHPTTPLPPVKENL